MRLHGKTSDRLRLAFIEELKIFFGQIGDRVAIRRAHYDRNQHQVDLALKSRRTVFLRHLRRGFLRTGKAHNNDSKIANSVRRRTHPLRHQFYFFFGSLWQTNLYYPIYIYIVENDIVVNIVIPRSHLQQLEAESIRIMREVVAECQRPVLLYSIGKDSSVLLRLAQKAFYPGPIPFPLLHVDTGYKFKEMIEFRDRYTAELGLNLIVHTNRAALNGGLQSF